MERSVGQVTVFSMPERRRRWSDEERLQIVAKAFAPGVRVADVCLRHDVSSGLIYTWRRNLFDAGAAQEAEGPEDAASIVPSTRSQQSLKSPSVLRATESNCDDGSTPVKRQPGWL